MTAPVKEQLDIEATDLFCGAGGSSEGARSAGVRLRMAANHWSKAIDVHQANFPHADHDCADVSQVDPRRYPRTQILMASPECTNHSSAKGVSRRRQDPSFFDTPDIAAERSRATMWDVHRFVEVHRYDAVIVENVVDATRWIYWPSWWQAWDDAGYDARVLSLNSAHTGLVPQWRDRIYIVATRRGLPAPDLDFRPPCWCSRCEELVAGVQSFRRPGARAGKWRQQYDYVCPSCSYIVAPPAPPASSIIDWELSGTRIGDRERPLAPNTRRRIELALEKYGTSLVAAAGNTYERPGSGYLRAWPLDQPTPTQSTTLQHGLAMLPFIVKNNGDASEAKYRGPFTLAEPLGTITTSPTMALIVPMHHGASGPGARPASSPHPTQTGRQEHALVIPMRTNGRGRPSSEPVATIAAGPGGGGMHLLFAPQSDGRGKPITNPAPSLATAATPLLVSYDHTEGAQPVAEPAVSVDDCLFRMLEPHEAGRAMAFPDEYIVEGTKRDRVRLYGNAVTPPVMRELVSRVAAVLA